MFRETGAAVSAATDSAQDPAIYSQFYGRFYLAGRPATAEFATSATPPFAASRPTAAHTIYAATAGGLSVSRDGGATWTTYTTANGLASNDVYSVYAQ